MTRRHSRAPRLDLAGSSDGKVASPATKIRLQRAMAALADVCDGAEQLDGSGFSALHVPLGHQLAKLPPDAWTDEMTAQAWELARIYRRQLRGLGFESLASIPRPLGADEGMRVTKAAVRSVTMASATDIAVSFKYDPELSGSLKSACRSATWDRAARVWMIALGDRDRLLAWAREHDFAVAEAVTAAEVPEHLKAIAEARGSVALDGLDLVLSFGYEPDLVTDVKRLAHRSFDNSLKAWRVPMHLVASVLEFAARWELTVSPDVEALAADPTKAVGFGTVTVSIDGPSLIVKPHGRQKEVGDLMRGIDRGSKWSRQHSAYLLPITRTRDVLHGLEGAGFHVVGAAALTARIAAMDQALAEASALDAELPPLPSLQVELRPFQRAGVAYALKHRRTFIGDEVGLGKTIQAIATLEYADAYPAVVFCPQTLRVNWLREFNAAVPHRHVMLTSGTTPVPFGMVRPDVVICHYEVARHWTKALAEELQPMGMVADESQLLKESGTYRSQAVRDLAHQIPIGDGIRLLLSATPVLNERKEYAPQLDILGRLEEFGGAAAIKRTPDIANRLRMAGTMVRRRKKHVMPNLPPVGHKAVPLECDPEVMVEYRRAETELLDYLAERAAAQAGELGLDPDSEAMKARMRAGAAEHLVRIGVLKRLAARAKMPAAKRWVTEYLANGDRLLLFAINVDVIDGIRDEFDCPTIVGGQTSGERMALVDEFQAGKHPLVGLNMVAGGVGLTMTAAKDVAFLQQGWTPAIHDQAIGRTYGRINDPHGADGYYLLGIGTIDLKIAQLIDDKRKEVDDATDGEYEGDEDGDATSSQSILGDLVVDLTHQALSR